MAMAAAAFIAGLRPPELSPKEAGCCCIHHRAEAGAFIVGPRPPELRPKEAVLRLSSTLLISRLNQRPLALWSLLHSFLG
jgi:hypothetical protein